MIAGALPDSSSVAPLYHNINKRKLFFVELIGVRGTITGNIDTANIFPFLVIFA